MKTQLSHCILILAFLSVVADGQQANEKAERYLEPLLKRPGSGPLFERFVDAWLDTDTLDNLEKYLASKVQAGDTTANRLLYAVFLSRQGETVKALEQFRAALAREPGSAEIWYQKAVVEARTLDFDSAVASLQKAREAKPAATLALQTGQLLGRLLARSGRTDEALKVWEELMTARPHDEELREDVLELQIAEGMHTAAQTTAEALVNGAKDPYKKILHRLRLGDVYDRAGARDKALETYASCLADAGADSWLEKEITAQLEKLFRREDDLAGLKTFYGKLLAKEPQRLGLRRAQAKLLVETGDVEAAVAAGQELLKLAPGDRAVREEFIALLAGARKLPEAIAQLEELRKQAPQDAELLLRLATLHNDAGGKKEAAALVQEYVKLSGDEASRLRASGLLERCGLMDEAAAVLRESPAPALRQSLASVLHKSGRKAEALAEWKQLAAGGTAAALEAARAMAAHDETDASLALLKEYAPQGEKDPAFLTALCQMAERTDQAAGALPYVRKLVARATLPADVEAALDLAVKLARRADQVESLTAELAGAATAQEFALLAALREEARDSAGAEAALKRAEAASPEIAASLLVRLYSQRADYQQAALALERLFNSPGGRKAHHAQALTDLWTRAGSVEKALKCVRDWRQLAPGSTAPVLAEASLLRSYGKDAESLEVLRRASGQFEGNEDIRAELADAYRDSGRMADAIRIYSALYENATELGAKMRWLQGWAQTAEQAGRTQELVEQFEERRRASRDSIGPLLALAEIHRAANNYDGRRKALMEAARLKQNDAELALEIARLEAREENEAAAVRTLRAALPGDKTGMVRQELVLMLLRSGEREEALRLLTDGQTDALKDPAVVESVAEGLMLRDTEETTLAFLKPHLTVHPEDYRLQLLGAHLEAEDNPEAAKSRLLRVLSQRTELPGARLKALRGTASPSGFDVDEYLNMFTSVLPPEASEFMSFALRSQEQVRTAQRGRGRQSQSVMLPENLGEAHLAAAARLLADERFADGDKEEALLLEMERAGFGTARIIRETGLKDVTSLFQDNSAALREASGAKPENGTLLALAAITQMIDWDEEADVELAGRVWKRFGKERPVLALLGALPAVGAEKPEPWEAEALSAAEAIEKPDSVLLIAAIRAIGSPWGNESDRKTLSPEVQKRVNALLQRWYTGSSFSGQMMTQVSVMIFMTLSNGYQAADDAAGFARLLDGEAARPAGAALQSGAAAVFGRGGRQRGVSAALGFPPRTGLPGMSPVLMSLLSAGGDDEFEFFNRGRMSPELLRKAADLVQHPVVKVMLLVRAGDDEAAGKLIEDRLGAPVPDTLSYLMAAGWAEKQEDQERAVELAKKALFLPLSKETRKALDAAFLFWAETGPPVESVRTAAREAALRMRRDALTPDARQQLIVAMDNLGLTSEAEKLARQEAGAAQGGTLPASPGRSPSQQVLTPSGKLLAAGRKEEALPLLTKELQAFGREALKQAGWSGVRGFDEWHSTLKEFAMVPAVMQAVTPPENADAKTYAQYGALLDLCGEAEKALEAYKKALAGGSPEPGVRFRLFRLVAAEDPALAARLLTELPADVRGTAFNVLASGRNYYGGASAGALLGGGFDDEDHGVRVSLNAVLDTAEVLEAYLQAAPPAEWSGSPWIAAGLKSVAQVARVGKGWVAPSLYSEQWSAAMTSSDHAAAELSAPPLFDGGEKPPALEDGEGVAGKIKRRAGMFDGMVNKLLDTPGTASIGWQALKLRGRYEEGKPMAPALFDAGISAVLLDLSEKKKPGARSNPPDEQGWYGVLGTLMPAALLGERLADLETKVLPVVRQSFKPRELEALERDWILHRCAEEEFPAKAREAVAKTRGAAWDMVFRTAVIRRTGVELPEELLAWMEPKIKANQDIREAAAATPRAAQLLLELRGRAAVESWLRGAWERMTGPRGERAKVMATMDEDGEIPDRKGIALQWMSWTNQQVREVPELLFLAVKIQEEEYDNLVPEKVLDNAESVDGLGRQSWMTAGIEHLTGLVKEKKLKEAVEWLKGSPFTGGAAEFRTAGGFIVTVVNALRSMDRAVLEELGISGGGQAQTFGLTLLTAGVDANRGRAVSELMARWQGDIAALPKRRKNEVVALLREWSSNAPLESLTKESRAFREWLEKADDADKLHGLDDEVDAFLEPKQLRELRTTGVWEFESKLRRLLGLILEAESPRAREVVEKVRETSQTASRSPEKNPLGEALRSLLNDYDSEPQKLGQAAGLLLHAATAPGPGAMPVTWDLVEALAEAGNDLGRLQSDPVARIKMTVDCLAPFVPEGQAPLLLPLVWETLSARSGGDSLAVSDPCQKVLEWVAGAGRSHPRQDIVRTIGHTAACLQRSTGQVAARKFRGVTAAQELPPDMQEWCAFLKDERHSVTVRLLLGCMVMRQDAWQVEDVFLREAAHLLEQAAQAGVPAQPWQETLVLEALNLRNGEEAASTAGRLLPLIKGGRGNSSLAEDMDRRAVKAQLRAALRSGNAEVANRVLRTFGDHGDAQMAAIVARHGTPVQMRNLVRPGRSGLFSEQPTEGSTNEPWRAALAGELDAALAQVEQADLRYLMTLSVNSLHLQSEDEPPSPRGPRLAALAKQFEAVPFREVALREQALELLAAEPEAAAVVAGAIRTSLEGLGIATIRSLRDADARRRKTRMFFAALSGAAHEGDFSLLERSVQELLAAGVTEGREDRTRFVEECLAAAAEGLTGDWRRNPEVLAKACAVWRRIMVHPEFLSRVQTWQRTALFTALLHALANRTTELDAWWQELPEEIRTKMEEGLAHTAITELTKDGSGFRRGAGHPVRGPSYTLPALTGEKDGSPGLRDEVFLRFVASPLSGSGMTGVEDFVTAGWGNISDAVRLEEQWCNAAPRRGLTARKFAEYHQQNRNYTGELAAAERGLKAVRPGRNGPGFDLVKWKIDALFQLNRSTEGTDLFLKIARLPAEHFQDPEARSYAEDQWRQCATQVLSGPPREAGSLSDTIRVAAVLFDTQKDKEWFWSALEAAGVCAAENLSRGNKPAEARAAAAFAGRARAKCRKTGGSPDAGWKTRAEAVLRGVSPSVPVLTKETVWRWKAGVGDEGPAWRMPGFNDSQWQSGEGPFGFEGGGMKTEIPNKVPGGGMLISWPLRTEFETGDPAAVSVLTLNLQVDGGAIVWINGKEAGRRNLPDGEVQPDTPALKPGNPADENQWQSLTLDPGVLIKGRNCLAVQVHRRQADGGEAAFHAELWQSTGTAGPAAETDQAIRLLEPQIKDWPEELRRVFIP